MGKGWDLGSVGSGGMLGPVKGRDSGALSRLVAREPRDSGAPRYTVYFFKRAAIDSLFRNGDKLSFVMGSFSLSKMFSFQMLPIRHLMVEIRRLIGPKSKEKKG